MQNKNTLRVTGGSPSKLGFDIRDHTVATYKDRNDLRDLIKAYLDTFFFIKKLPLSEKAESSYCREVLDQPFTIIGTEKEDRRSDLNILPGQYLDFRMRDRSSMAKC